MDNPLLIRTAAVALGLAFALTLAACAHLGATDQPRPVTASATQPPPVPTTVALKGGHSSLGPIAVDGRGRTVYTYADDKQGTPTSECSGDCLTAWPAVPAHTDLEAPGVTAKVGTAKAADGTSQLTLNGYPLYYFAGDTKTGDLNGQGDEGEWWVITPAGDKVMSLPAGAKPEPDDDEGGS